MRAILANYYIPGLNVAFLFSFAVTIALTLLLIPIAKRRPQGHPLTWGEAVIGATYVFFILFLAYGIVPHSWLAHADNELQWRKDKVLIGPQVGDRHLFQYLPFTITYEAIRDVVVVGIYALFLGLQIFVWTWWQRRSRPKPSTEVAVSTYGRPLVRRG